MKRLAIVALLIPWLALAGSIKSWGTNDQIQASDLNANFNHIHNSMVGGHGARLVNSDVSPSAAISHSKLATPALVPKAFAAVTTVCTASPCTLADSSQVTSIARTGAGAYTVTLAYTPANASFAAIVTAKNTAADAAHKGYCMVTNVDNGVPNINIACFDSTGAAADMGLFLIVMDT